MGHALSVATYNMGNSLENHRVRKNHVANACDEVIYAQVLNDKDSETAREHIAMEFGGIKLPWSQEKTIELIGRCGFTPIAPNSYLAFTPNSRDTAYISIFTESGKIVSTNFPVKENRSVKVDSNGFIKRVQYGSIWTET